MFKVCIVESKDPDYETKCSQNHNKSCDECFKLSQTLTEINVLIQNAINLSKEEKAEIEYDTNRSIHSIQLWKAHILMTINQERAKQKILEELDEETAFVVIDFAMKFLARKYRESMANWFGKAGMGMYVSCVVPLLLLGKQIKRLVQ